MFSRMTTSLGCALVALALVGAPALGATLHVDRTDPAAYQSIQKAIDAAWDFDTIIVHPGTYYEHVDYHGAMVTVTGSDPDDPAVVESTIIDGANTGSVVAFHNSEGRHAILRGVTVRKGQNGISCVGAGTAATIDRCRVVSNTAAGIACSLASPTITDCTIENNTGAGVSGSLGETRRCRISFNGDGVADHAGTVKNCVISANRKSGIYFSATSGCNVINCTIAGNKNSGVFLFPQKAAANFSVTNSIIVLNEGFAFYSQDPGWGAVWKVHVDWSDIWGNLSGNSGGDLSPSVVVIQFGTNCMYEDPLFAKRGYWDTSAVWHEGDYHLKSQVGRWDPRTLTWVPDPIDSPCLDRGDPTSPYLDEPAPNGARVNLGAYGGTAEASKSPGGAACLEYPEMDFNHDCKVNEADLDIFMQHWLECGLDPSDACTQE